jgi:DnaJ-class molecular chaperone
MIKKWIAALVLLAIFTAVTSAQSAQSHTKKSTAEVHIAGGLTCTNCHGEGPKKPAARDKCQECHGDYKDLAKATNDLEPNPHYNHTIDLDCNACHHMHKASEVYCHRCHQQLQFVKKPAIAEEGK